MKFFAKQFDLRLWGSFVFIKKKYTFELIIEKEERENVISLKDKCTGLFPISEFPTFLLHTQ